MSSCEWGYVTSWDTWEQAEAAFPIAPGFKLEDDATGRVWLARSPYVGECDDPVANAEMLRGIWREEP